VTANELATAPSIQYYLEQSNKGFECSRVKSEIIVKLKQNTGGSDVLDRLKASALEQIA
jgi:hypothetical protein